MHISGETLNNFEVDTQVRLCRVLLPLVGVLFCGFLVGAPLERGAKPGDPLPVLRLTDANGAAVPESLPGNHVEVLLFVRPLQHYSTQALECCERVVEDSGNGTLRRIWVGSDPSETPEKWRSKSWYDTQRKTSAPLEIIVHPYTIIVDAQNKVVTTLASFPPRYEAQLESALLLASGEIDRAEFERRMSSPHDSNTHESTGNRARLICNLARQLANRQQHARAEEEFKRALSLDSQNTFVVSSYVSYLLSRDRIDLARTQFDAIPEADRAAPPLQLLRARLFLAERQPQQALVILEALSDRIPQKEVLWLELGRAHEMLENWKEAATYYRRGLEAALQVH